MSAGYIELRQMHDLPSFVLQLHLLACVEILTKSADLRYEIVCYLILEYLRLDVCAVGVTCAACCPGLKDGLGFIVHLNRTCSASAACSLIGRCIDALDLRQLIDSVDSYQSNDGRAVRITDDAVMLLCILRIDLRM